MNILQMIPYAPVPPSSGGAIRIHHILRALAERHNLTVLGFGTPEQLPALAELHPAEVMLIDHPWFTPFRRLTQFYAFWSHQSFFSLAVRSRTMQEAISGTLARKHFDAVHMEFPLMGGYDYPGGALRVLDAHNVEYENFRRMHVLTTAPLRRMHYHSEYLKVREEERAVCRAQDLILTTSVPDKQILDRDVPGVPKVVIPNGVDLDYFAPSDEEPDPFTIVFTGTMAYVPNYDGMHWFLDEIFPLITRECPRATVCIVGDRPPASILRRRSPSVIVTGYVKDVRPYVRRAPVVIVPLRMGSGTRLKILEAMGMRKAVVTTRIGCEGLDVVDGESVLTADDPGEFAACVVRLLRDRELRERIARGGNELAHAEYA